MNGALTGGIRYAEDERDVVALSRSFGVPLQKVKAIYTEQLQRVAEGARIKTFLSILAIRETRSILRDSKAFARASGCLAANGPHARDITFEFPQGSHAR